MTRGWATLGRRSTYQIRQHPNAAVEQMIPQKRSKVNASKNGLGYRADCGVNLRSGKKVGGTLPAPPATHRYRTFFTANFTFSFPSLISFDGIPAGREPTRVNVHPKCTTHSRVVCTAHVPPMCATRSRVMCATESGLTPSAKTAPPLHPAIETVPTPPPCCFLRQVWSRLTISSIQQAKLDPRRLPPSRGYAACSSHREW